MIDKTEALKHIRTLAQAGLETDDPDLMRKHFEMILEIVRKEIDPSAAPQRC